MRFEISFARGGQVQTKPRRDIGQLVQDKQLVIDALSRAAREALLLDRKLGIPVPIWRDGRTEWVPPEEIDGLLAHYDGVTSAPPATAEATGGE